MTDTLLLIVLALSTLNTLMLVGMRRKQRKRSGVTSKLTQLMSAKNPMPQAKFKPRAVSEAEVVEREKQAKAGGWG